MEELIESLKAVKFMFSVQNGPLKHREIAYRFNKVLLLILINWLPIKYSTFLIDIGQSKGSTSLQISNHNISGSTGKSVADKGPVPVDVLVIQWWVWMYK